MHIHMFLSECFYVGKSDKSIASYKAGYKWDICMYTSDESIVYISVFLLNIPIHPVMYPSTLHLTISVIPTKSEANIDWLFAISFQSIIDICLSFSYVSDYSFLPILNISPFKIMCISLHRPLCNAFSSSFSRTSLTSFVPSRYTNTSYARSSRHFGGPQEKGFKMRPHIYNQLFKWLIRLALIKMA